MGIKLDEPTIVGYGGILLIGFGTWFIYWPAAFIVVGALLYITIIMPRGGIEE